MTRIAYVTPTQMSESARELTLERGNLNVYRALANAKNMFTGWMVAGRSALVSSVVSPRLRELVILRTAYLMESLYEIGQHTTAASRADVSPREIAGLGSAWQTSTDVFGGVELSVLRLTTELVTTKGVTGALFDEVHNALGSQATVEVLMLINRWSGLALMLNALDVDLDTNARISIPRA
ncbi:carboxymuconolactone decarboxylase family protein [Mycobacterium sp. UM_CSW]|uniref:carboxymuconolactone decarboxylase family protein n=1 Tax=Mycobacterium sp. UM_CSW TaxID=1370119 RepID=UPI00082EED65|nr:carboxymuconolactone decarboxylase family protein [Mycobacterium sp. UM_CSW]